MRQSRGNRCLHLLSGSGKKENASQKQSTQKTSGCIRLVSWGQRSVRGVKNEWVCTHVHLLLIYFKNTFLRCDTKMIFLTDTILQRMFVPLDSRPFKDNDNLCPF